MAFYQGEAHGGDRIAELRWSASMHPSRGSFADPWVSLAERQSMAARVPHLGVIVTYVDQSGKWCPSTIATESARARSLALRCQ